MRNDFNQRYGFMCLFCFLAPISVPIWLLYKAAQKGQLWWSQRHSKVIAHAIDATEEVFGKPVLYSDVKAELIDSAIEIKWINEKDEVALCIMDYEYDPGLKAVFMVADFYGMQDTVYKRIVKHDGTKRYILINGRRYYLKSAEGK